MANEHSFQSSDVTLPEEVHARRQRLRVAAIVLAALVLVALLVTSFAGAATQAAPRDLPIAVTGGEAAAAAVAEQFEQQSPGGFEVIAVADATQAQALIRDREVYGALVTEGPQVTELLVASAASPAVSSLLTELGDGIGVVEVTDVVGAPADDPRGGGLAAGALPITIGGVITGTLVALMVSRRRDQVAAVAAMALLVGTTVVAVLHGGYGALAGPVWLEVAAVSAGVGTIGLMLAGLNSALGRPGLIAGDLVLILVGNPFSAANAAPEMLPEPWGDIGHWMPLGATVDLLRGISGFDGAATAAPWLALAVWTAVGLVLLALPPRWTRRASHTKPTHSASAHTITI